MDLVQVLPNALKCPCVSIKHALKKQGIKTPKPLISQGFQVSVSILVTQDGCGGRTRTYGLRVMSPTSYQLLHSAILNLRILVPVTGLEPVQYCYRGILSPLCLPVPPHRQISATVNIPHLPSHVNTSLQKFFRFFFVPLTCHNACVILY